MSVFQEAVVDVCFQNVISSALQIATCCRLLIAISLIFAELIPSWIPSCCQSTTSFRAVSTFLSVKVAVWTKMLHKYKYIVHVMSHKSSVGICNCCCIYAFGRTTISAQPV